MTITTKDKLQAAQQALRDRQLVYPLRVQQGLMAQHQMDHEIACMSAIVADYARQLDTDAAQQDLFATQETP